MAQVLFMVCVPARLEDNDLHTKSPKVEADLKEVNETDKKIEAENVSDTKAEEPKEEKAKEQANVAESNPDSSVKDHGWDFKDANDKSVIEKINKEKEGNGSVILAPETSSTKLVKTFSKDGQDTVSKRNIESPDTSRDVKAFQKSISQDASENRTAAGEQNTAIKSKKDANKYNNEKKVTVEKDTVKKVKLVDDKAAEEKEGNDDLGTSLDTEFVRFLEDDWTLIEKVKAALDDLHVPGVQWSITNDDIYVGIFIAGDGNRCEEILHRLSYLKIGVIPKSSISVFPASISISSIPEEKQAEKLKQMIEKEDKLAERVSEFKKSIKSRLVVAQVVDSVKSDALFTFDYLMLIILASLVALMGLLEASSVTLVASMLISPLMGPILAGVFGAVIRNTDLLMVGIKSELMGLGLCILVGFFTGFIPSVIESAGIGWRSTDSWPTVEMSSRGSLRSLPVGILIAIPSGAGVALSILGGKVGSLVGVAISASLLPPAVNAGLLWANAIVVYFTPPPTVYVLHLLPSANFSYGGDGRIYDVNGTCVALVDNQYSQYYYCDMAKESAVLGVVSLFLTILNIVCIIIMGIAVLKIKEVAPIRAVPVAEKDFFGKDLKFARQSYQTTKGEYSAILGKKFLQEYKKFKEDIGVEDDNDDNDDGDTEEELNQIIGDVEDEPEVKEITNRLPHKPRRWSSVIDTETAKGPDKVYHTIHVGSISSLDSTIQSKKKLTSPSNTSISQAKDGIEGHQHHYFTIHRRNLSPAEALHGPVSPRGSGRFSKLFSPKSSRFQVAKVEEAGSHIINKPPTSRSASPIIKMPPISEQEQIPLLTFHKCE